MNPNNNDNDVDLNDPNNRKIFEKFKKMYNINDNPNMINNQNMMMNPNMMNNQNMMMNPNMMNNQNMILNQNMANQNMANSQNMMMNQNMVNQNMMNNQNMMMYPNNMAMFPNNINNQNMMMNNPNFGNMNGINNMYMNNMYMNMNNNPSYNCSSMNNSMNQNPNIINNMNNSNNQQINNINNNFNGILPRGKICIGKMKSNDKPINEIGGIINIKFESNTGPTTIINIDKNATLKEALKMFCQKMGISEELIGNKINFVYHSKRLDYSDGNRTLKDEGIRNASTICAYDISNLVGN